MHMIEGFLGCEEFKFVEKCQALEHGILARARFKKFMFIKEKCMQVERFWSSYANKFNESNGLKEHGIQTRKLGLMKTQGVSHSPRMMQTC